ncbi:MAG TPA: hypothetical protein VF861_00600 [Telluria sp.]
MRTTLKTLAAGCAGALLLGCANLGHHAAPPAPAHAAGSADDAYVIGRQLHLSGRHLRARPTKPHCASIRNRSTRATAWPSSLPNRATTARLLRYGRN